jgi:hypothetical protein
MNLFKEKISNYSVHPVYDHSPALDSGFRRNDVSSYAVFKSVMPAKSGVFRYPGLFLDLLTALHRQYAHLFEGT